MTVRVICDSTADLDAAFRDAHRVEVVPLQVIIGDQSFRDGIDITPTELYQRMRRDGVTARTSQPAPAAFEAVFRAATDAGDSVLCTTISGELSGTYTSAAQAAEALGGRPITVIDSRSVNVGHYAVVAEAVRVAEAGGDLESVSAAVRTLIDRIRLVFTVETLEYLRRGGRIGGARALLGSVLDVKPILEMQHGAIEPVGRVRTYRRAIDSCADMAVRAAEEWGGAHLFIGEGDAGEAAEQLAGRLRAALPGAPITTIHLGPVVGAHAGPGAVGLAFHPPTG